MSFVPFGSIGYFHRPPTFDLTGHDGDRWSGNKPFDVSAVDVSAVLPNLVAGSRDLDDMARSAERLANHIWANLWGRRSVDELNMFIDVGDSAEGDIKFLAWVELLLLLDHSLSALRGPEKKLRKVLAEQSWTVPWGAGLLAIAHFHRNGAVGFKDHGLTLLSSKRARALTYKELLELRSRAGEIVNKFLELLQRPSMDDRFKAFFTAVSQHLNKPHEDLYESLWDIGLEDGIGQYPNPLRIKIAQVLGLLEADPEEVITLDEALGYWVSTLEKPSDGWLLGTSFESMVRAERLAEIAVEASNGRLKLPATSKKPVI
ncbi:hypothetical protein [Luteimonas sp. SDU101]|uniref:hypothetical protein n=1 Tax=Luteimonas sp. SDU101 TaxID=3422593 RepID=UPI003EBC1614